MVVASNTEWNRIVEYVLKMGFGASQLFADSFFFSNFILKSLIVFQKLIVGVFSGHKDVRYISLRR